MSHLILIIGLQGVGKTTLANRLKEQLGGIGLSTEKIRHSLFYVDNFSAVDCDFSPEELILCYRSINYFTRLLLNERINIIVDGVFRSKTQRDALLADVPDLCKVTKVYLWCSDQDARRRLQKRREAGNIAPAGVNTYMKTKVLFETPDDSYITFNTSIINSNDIADTILCSIVR